MKKILFWILFFWIWNSSFSQSALPKHKADSLWTLWINPDQPDTVRITAMIYYGQGGYLYKKPDSCFYFAQLAYDFALAGGYKKEMANARKIQGNSWIVRANYPNAQTCYLESLALYEECNLVEGIAASYHGLASVFLNKGDYSEALNYQLKSFEIYERTGNKKEMATLLNDIGVNYVDQGSYDIGIDYYEKSLDIRNQLNDKKGSASSLVNLGNVYNILGDFPRALDYYARSYSIAKEKADKSLMASCLNNMGLVYADQGDWATALELYRQSLILKIEMVDKRGQGNSLINIGLVYYSYKSLDSAQYYYLRGLSLFEETGNKLGMGRVFNNLGNMFIYEGDFPKAKEYYQKSLEIRLEINDKKGIASTYINLGVLYNAIGDFESAIENNLKAYEIAAQIGAMQEIKNAVSGLYKSYINMGNWTRALEYLSLIRQNTERDLRTNYFALSQREKELYFATMEDAYANYFDYTLHRHAFMPAIADTAFNIACMIKGLSQKSTSAMRNIVLESADSSLISTYDQWILLKKKIANYYTKGKDTKQLEDEATGLEKELILRSGAFSDFDKIKNLDWKQVRDGLKEDEAAIEFVHFKSEIDSANPVVYAAFVVRPDSEHPNVVRLCTEDDLKNILGVLQGNNLSFVEKVYGKKSEAKKDLYEKIWKPLEPFLQGVKTVHYSPSGLLHKVSFAAICKEQDVFLSDVYNFRQLGSTGKVALPDDIAFGEMENFMLMGGVNYNSDSSSKEVWSYLPGSLQETNAINSYLIKKKFGVNYFHSNNASEEIFKEKISTSSIIHIATHGFFFPDPMQVREEMKAEKESEKNIEFRGTTNYANWSFVNNKNPLMRSGIVLANANDVWQRDPLSEGEDGVLTAQEVSNLDLRNTKLVVLSACETGLGDIKGSEGVFGLQRAFKMAGVKYLIMSLWQVPDKETAEFMILFYKNLIKLKDIPTAFQKTQKVMREKYDPYYWGAFVLIE